MYQKIGIISPCGIRKNCSRLLPYASLFVIVTLAYEPPAVLAPPDGLLPVGDVPLLLVVPALGDVPPLVVPALGDVPLVVKADSAADNDVRAAAVLPALRSDIAVLMSALACERGLPNAVVPALVDVPPVLDDGVPPNVSGVLLLDVPLLLVVVVLVVLDFFLAANAEPYKSWPAIAPSTSVDAKRVAPRIAKVESFLLIEA